MLSLFLFRKQSVALLYPSVLAYLLLRPRSHVNGETTGTRDERLNRVRALPLAVVES